MKTLTGIIRGRTIELAEAPGFAEGQQVVVQMTIANGEHPTMDLPRGGSMSAYWTEEDDRILAQIQADRKMPSTRVIPE